MPAPQSARCTRGRSRPGSESRRLIALLLLAAVPVLGACSGGAKSPGRPVLAASVVPAVAPGDWAPSVDAELEFLDAVAGRPLVCRDEAVHAALLLGNGSSAPDARSRAALAAQLGYTPPFSGRSPREAATLGEVAQMVAAVLERGPGVRSQEEALASLVSRGFVPASSKAYQGLTGAQLLTILAGARAELGHRELARVRLDQAEPRGKPKSPQAASALASADAGGGAAAAGDPLPESATDPAIERPTGPSGRSAPAAPPPRPQPQPNAAPEPPAPIPTGSPSPGWVPGRPLKRAGQ